MNSLNDWTAEKEAKKAFHFGQFGFDARKHVDF
jgi:hypothetical protein